MEFKILAAALIVDTAAFIYSIMRMRYAERVEREGDRHYAIEIGGPAFAICVASVVMAFPLIMGLLTKR